MRGVPILTRARALVPNASPVVVAVELPVSTLPRPRRRKSPSALSLTGVWRRRGARP